MWYRKSFFKIIVCTLLILLIVYTSMQILPIIQDLFGFLSTLLFPLIIAVVLYYILRPLRDFLQRHGWPRFAAVVSSFCLLFILLGLVITFIWPYIGQQINEFASTPQAKLKQLENTTVDILNLLNFGTLSQEELRALMLFYFQKMLSYVTADLLFTLSSIAKVASFFIVTPFIFFYLLKDDENFYAAILKETPVCFEYQVKKILKDVDNVLVSYIGSQLSVAFCVGILIYIGYWAIGLNYAFLLAVFAFLFNLIPFCGPFISTIPALLIGLSVSPFMGLKVILVVMGVHLLDLNLISPRIVGPRLKLHPVTIILLLVASISSFGILGLFVIVPLYAVLKIILLDLYQMRRAAQEMGSSVREDSSTRSH